MCTLVAAVGLYADAPLVVAANRDEMLARPAIPPFLWSGEPREEGPRARFVAPRDEVAHGSWLGLSERALFVGVTNRAGRPPDPTRRSRGALVTDSLGARSAKALHAELAGLDPRAYNGFHLLYADRATAHLTWSTGDTLHQEDLAPGVHVVTERSFGAGGLVDARGGLVREQWAALGAPPSVAELGALLGRHAPDGEEPFAGTCVHADAFGYGTRSSMVLTLGWSWEATKLAWAEGRPCVTPFVEQEALLRALAAGAADVAGVGG